MSIRRLAALLSTVDVLAFDATPYTVAALDAFAADLEAHNPQEWARVMRAAKVQASALAA